MRYLFCGCCLHATPLRAGRPDGADTRPPRGERQGAPPLACGPGNACFRNQSPPDDYSASPAPTPARSLRSTSCLNWPPSRTCRTCRRPSSGTWRRCRAPMSRRARSRTTFSGAGHTDRCRGGAVNAASERATTVLRRVKAQGPAATTATNSPRSHMAHPFVLAARAPALGDAFSPSGAALINGAASGGKGRRPAPQLDKRGVDGAEVDGQIEPKPRQPPRHWRRRSRAEHADREARRPGAMYARCTGPKGQGGRSQIFAMLQGSAR